MSLLDIFFPRQCFNCQSEGKYLCDKCSLFLVDLPDIKMEGFEQVTCCWEYNGIAKKIISEAKTRGMFDALRELTDKALSERETLLPDDLLITFVPMEEKEERLKGFNHAEVIAKQLGRITDRKVISLLEQKLENKQEGLGKEERFTNARRKFAVKKDIKLPQNILLVDDFITSGATMIECSKALRCRGAKKVWGFTLAKVN